MIYPSTIHEIRHNSNPGVEYEIALFYVLLKDVEEKRMISDAFRCRTDADIINNIIARTDIGPIVDALKLQGLTYVDCSFETQNDDVGPADIVLHLSNDKKLGISVKYSNTCTLNLTGINFISPEQKTQLELKQIEYTKKYICEMCKQFGPAYNWFRKRKFSKSTEDFIDLIREAVIENWNNIPRTKKEKLLQSLYHADSPIDYWVVEYTKRTMILNSNPIKIPTNKACSVKLRKYKTSFIAFYLDEVRIGHMQVKFNNGILECCKKATPDLIVDGIDMVYGKPFSSWNFNIER